MSRMQKNPSIFTKLKDAFLRNLVVDSFVGEGPIPMSKNNWKKIIKNCLVLFDLNNKKIKFKDKDNLN